MIISNLSALNKEVNKVFFINFYHLNFDLILSLTFVLVRDAFLHVIPLLNSFKNVSGDSGDDSHRLFIQNVWTKHRVRLPTASLPISHYRWVIPVKCISNYIFGAHLKDVLLWCCIREYLIELELESFRALSWLKIVFEYNRISIKIVNLHNVSRSNFFVKHLLDIVERPEPRYHSDTGFVRGWVYKPRSWVELKWFYFLVIRHLILSEGFILRMRPHEIALWVILNRADWSVLYKVVIVRLFYWKCILFFWDRGLRSLFDSIKLILKFLGRRVSRTHIFQVLVYDWLH
jgi:hypothetical protein